MIQAGNEFDFALETRGQLLPSREIGEEDLHGLNAVGDDVPYPPYSAHSAAAQLIENLVIADPLGFVGHIKDSASSCSLLAPGLASRWRQLGSQKLEIMRS